MGIESIVIVVVIVLIVLFVLGYFGRGRRAWARLRARVGDASLGRPDSRAVRGAAPRQVDCLAAYVAAGD
jgi:hypothetical protein